MTVPIIWLVVVIVVISGFVGYFMDAVFRIKEPILYWMVGLVTGMAMVTVLMNGVG